MLTEINVLGVPPERGVINLCSARIALDIAKAAQDIIMEKGDRLSNIAPRDLAVYMAIQRRPQPMTRVTLLTLLSHCNGELEVIHELANMGWLPTYLVPSFNLENHVSDSVEYILFIVPKVIPDLKPTGSQLVDLMEHIKRTEEKLDSVSRDLGRTRTTNKALSEKIDALQKETESLKQGLKKTEERGCFGGIHAVNPNPTTSVSNFGNFGPTPVPNSSWFLRPGNTTAGSGLFKGHGTSGTFELRPGGGVGSTNPTSYAF
jgi:hypothetical protein